MAVSTRRQAPKSAPVVYGVLTAALVIVIASVAVVARSSSTPAIAEFGPSAQEQIQDARSDQARSADNSRGAANQGCGSASPSSTCDPNAAQEAGSTTTTTAAPIDVPAGRRCYGQPPRQTEDPHSPPCKFEIFHGDNGGKTAPKGVTGSEIKVAFPITSAGDKGQMETVNSLVNHFNQRYEFYGRRITPVFVARWPFDNAAENQATADELADTNAFAVATGTLYWNANASIHRRLASEGIISVVGQQTAFGTKDIVEGLTWTVDPPMDQRLRTGGRFTCRALKGKSAIHAGADLRSKTRKFAVVVLQEQAGGPEPGPLTETLDACGLDYKVFRLNWWASYPDFTTLMNSLKTDGYTTVLPVSPYVKGDMYAGATRAQYFPEWVDFGVAGAHLEYMWGGPGSSDTVGHAAHAFGVVGEFSIRPGVGEARALAAWREGGARGDGNAEPWYDPLLVIAAGIQGAGPNLNTKTFAEALRTMRFPNPNAGSPPYWQPGVGFGRSDPAFRNDYAVWWWSDQAQAQQTVVGDDGRGSFCYVARGARFTAETFPPDADARIGDPSVPCR